MEGGCFVSMPHSLLLQFRYSSGGIKNLEKI